MTTPAASAAILDGNALARSIRERLRAKAEAIRPAPGLRVLLVGENPASVSYVTSKTKAALEAGIRAETLRLPADISPDGLLAEVARANADSAVDGILIQLPLPPGQPDWKTKLVLCGTHRAGREGCFCDKACATARWIAESRRTRPLPPESR